MRACSGLTSRLILTYVEREGGRSAVDAVLRRTGLTELGERLRDENAWFSFETKVSLWRAAAVVLGDPKVARHAGAAALDLNIAAGLKSALRALGTPDLVYRNVGRANAKFCWSHKLEVIGVGDCRARVRFVDVSEAGYDATDCDYTAGMLEVVPALFGLPPAHVRHLSCGLRGDDGCEYEIAWTGGTQKVKRAAYVLGMAGGVTAALGAIAVPPLLPAAGAMVLGGGGYLGVHGALYARRRLQSLERRVIEQEQAADRMFESLADLSSDLRPGEVLDKVAGRAKDAVGGTEFALLLDDGTTMRTNRHSGISDEALAALEAWAAHNRDLLRDAPILVDDLSTDPCLGELSEDPELPLGSMCAAAMVFRDEMLGVLVALAHGATVFLPHDSEALAAYAAQAAIAVSNARLVDRLERQAAEDFLTGLANQRAFYRACTAEFARAEREDLPTAIVAVDLDHFKSINDTHGHLYGDEVLKAVADSLRKAVRPHDTVARLGGEEFALLLPGATLEDAVVVAERARAEISRVALVDRVLSASAGVASHPQADAPATRLLQLADRALYAAKHMGRDRTVRYEAHIAAAPDATISAN